MLKILGGFAILSVLVANYRKENNLKQKYAGLIDAVRMDALEHDVPYGDRVIFTRAMCEAADAADRIRTSGNDEEWEELLCRWMIDDIDDIIGKIRCEVSRDDD